MTVFNITIYFDTICPWCYIGDKVFDQALSLFKKTYPGGSTDQFNIQWMPYYLAAPAVGTPMEERMAEKNGAERVKGIQTRLQRVGRQHGIYFTFGGKIGKTHDSHRLIYAAGKEHPELQKALIDEVFRFFETDRDFTSKSDLLQAAIAVGFPKERARAVLESDEYGHIVDELADKAKRDGVSSVPTFVLNGVRIEGAEDPSAFYEAFIKGKENEAATNE